MKTLTIKQPWAELIACGDKRIENRTWRTKHRGRIAIHAGLDKRLVLPGELEAFDYGAIIATASLIDCVELSDPAAPLWIRSHRYTEGPWCWVLADVKRLRKPVPIKGALGLWEWQA